MFSDLFPILSTPDLARAHRFYVEAMGGVETYRFPQDDDPVFVTVDVAGTVLGLGQDDGADPSGSPHALCVYVDDCDAAVAHLTDHGATVVESPADQPWGERSARVADPDGNQLVIVARP